MSAHIVVLAGDGVGPEVTAEAVRVLEQISVAHALRLEFEDALIGGAAYDAAGSPLPEKTIAACKASTGILLGAVGGPKWADIPVQHRPEQGLLAIRKALGLFANLRPVATMPELASASPLRPEKLQGVDILVIRELTGGIYFGKRSRSADAAFDTCEYTVGEIERVCRVAGELAVKRRCKVTSVDKANVLETSRLWRTVVSDVGREYPDVTLDHMLVDSCAMRIALAPASFDVIVTDNMFGDILSDEAGAVVGSLGLLPSASLGSGPGLFEPVHGSAPDIAGKNIANPIGAIASAAMLLRHALELDKEATAVDRAIESALGRGLRTLDLAQGSTAVSTGEMARAIVEGI
jgi:3-isopropylmalate dehydrogenase